MNKSSQSIQQSITTQALAAAMALATAVGIISGIGGLANAQWKAEVARVSAQQLQSANVAAAPRAPRASI